MRDALLILQADTTKTADFNGAWIDLGAGGLAHSTMFADINFRAATNASGANDFKFRVEASADQSVVVIVGESEIVTLSTTAQNGKRFIAVQTPLRYIRLVADVTGAGSTPTITYNGALVGTRP